MKKILSVLFLTVMCVQFIKADVNTLRFQRQESHEMRGTGAYPAAGYRPNRRFDLPNESQQPTAANEENPQRRPDLTYGIPPAAQSQQKEQQQEQAPNFLAPRSPQPPARFTAAMESAQLAVNSEDSQDDENDAEIATDIEVDGKMENGQRGNAPSPAAQPSIVYYPAGAVSFVQPIAGTFAQPVPQAPAPVAPIMSSSAEYVQSIQYAKLQAQPLTERIEAQTVANFVPETAVYASPAAAYTTVPFNKFTAAQYKSNTVAPLAFTAAPYTLAVSPVSFNAAPGASAAFTATPAKLQVQAIPQAAKLEAQYKINPVAPLTFTAAPYTLALNPVSFAAAPAAFTATSAKLQVQAIPQAAKLEAQSTSNISPAPHTYATLASLNAASDALTAAPASFALSPAATAATTFKSAATFVQPQQYYISTPAQLQAAW